MINFLVSNRQYSSKEWTARQAKAIMTSAIHPDTRSLDRHLVPVLYSSVILKRSFQLEPTGQSFRINLEATT